MTTSILPESGPPLRRREEQRQRRSLRGSRRTPLSLQPKSRHRGPLSRQDPDEHTAAARLSHQERSGRLDLRQRADRSALRQELAATSGRRDRLAHSQVVPSTGRATPSWPAAETSEPIRQSTCGSLRRENATTTSCTGGKIVKKGPIPLRRSGRCFGIAQDAASVEARRC